MRMKMDYLMMKKRKIMKKYQIICNKFKNKTIQFYINYIKIKEVFNFSNYIYNSNYNCNSKTYSNNLIKLILFSSKIQIQILQIIITKYHHNNLLHFHILIIKIKHMLIIIIN